MRHGVTYLDDIAPYISDPEHDFASVGALIHLKPQMGQWRHANGSSHERRLSKHTRGGEHNIIAVLFH